MGLFNRNSGGAAGDLNQGNNLTVIEHRFEPGEIAYKWPEENVSAGSVLFVNPGQHALIICEGQIDYNKSEGKYNLNTDNFPVLSKVAGKLYGGQIYRCRIIFINMEREFHLNFGGKTEAKDFTLLRDYGPIHPFVNGGIPVKQIQYRGTSLLKIDDAEVFFVKTLGQSDDIDEDKLDDFLFEKLNEVVKSSISKKMQSEKLSILEIGQYYSELSTKMNDDIMEMGFFERLGLRLTQLAISSIDLPEAEWTALNDKINKFREEFQDIFLKQARGSIYEKELAADVLKTAAANEGGGAGGAGGNMMGMGMGLGMGLGLGGGFGQAMGGMASGLNTPNNQSGVQQASCPHCGSTMPANAKFCPVCGKPPVQQEICPSCGMANPQGAKFCAGCGKPLGPQGKKCPSCGTDNAPGAKFCASCGSPLEPAKKKCPSCGAENEPSAGFCASCGTKLG